jgi:hypothetical protein
MDKWEYCLVQITGTAKAPIITVTTPDGILEHTGEDARIAPVLNGLGGKGWEAVSISSMASGENSYFSILLKRKK